MPVKSHVVWLLKWLKVPSFKLLFNGTSNQVRSCDFRCFINGLGCKIVAIPKRNCSHRHTQRLLCSQIVPYNLSERTGDYSEDRREFTDKFLAALKPQPLKLIPHKITGILEEIGKDQYRHLSHPGRPRQGTCPA